ncbi:DUF6233 domain-containing protein [Streptomyces sp. NPDC056500]|uniref:DUF6233 domain-containing protein n=1 Tax=Streptomyces sp. NPDC056500 TaxID=3345840 RepID=UPI0036753FAE
MNDYRLREELEKLRFLRRAQLQQLKRVDGWIAAAQKRLRDAEAATPPAPPASPVREWVAYTPLNARQPVEIHRAHCFVKFAKQQTRAITTAEAVQLLGMGAVACEGCRPDPGVSVG